jgi:hypothetical protein
MPATPADGDEHHVGLERLRLAAGRRLDRDLARRARFLDCGHLVPELEAHALLGQDLLHLAGDLGIKAGQDAVEELDDRDLRAEPPPHRAELQPDDAGADHEQPLRHLRQRQRAGGGDDRLFVDVDAGQRRHVGAGGNDHGLGLERLLLAVDEGDLDLARAGNAGRAVEVVHLVLAQQERHPVDVALHALVLEGHHLAEVELRLDLDPHVAQAVARLLEKLGSVQQRLGRDAADVEAGAAVGGPLLDHGDLEAELAGADGADVAAGAGSDDDEVEGAQDGVLTD